jgi:hypothetical protein
MLAATSRTPDQPGLGLPGAGGAGVPDLPHLDDAQHLRGDDAAVA